MFYCIWIWGLSRLDDTSIGNYVQFYIKGLNHLCGIQIYRGALCVKDLVDSCTRYDIWGRKMLVKYRCLPLFIRLRMYSAGQYLMLLQLGSVSYMYSHYCTVSATGLSSALVQWFGSSCKDQGCISCTPRCPPAGLWHDSSEGSQGLLGQWVLGPPWHFLF